MSLNKGSLLSLTKIKPQQVIRLFELAKKIKTLRAKNALKLNNLDKSMAMVFFEPSTRTRASFQFAAFNLGMRVLSQFYGESTSVAKGETEIDTVLNILALRPDILVVRYGDIDELDLLLGKIDTPVINAGSGRRGHPTQALGDLFTIWQASKDIKKEKVLLIGDINHSRVAASTSELLNIMGVEYAYCGPIEWLPLKSKVKKFELKEGLKWATVCMPLRIQWERHEDKDTSPWRDKKKYHETYGINELSAKHFGKGLIMSPGPINFSVEMSREVLNDKRCKVLEQVENGMLVRSSIMSEILGIKVGG